MHLDSVLASHRPRSRRKRHLIHQHLIVQIEAGLVLVRQLAEIHKAILRHKVVVAHREDKVLVPVIVRSMPRIRRDHADGFPFLIQQPAILRTAVMRAKLVQLAVDVHVDPGAVLGGHDAGLEDAGAAGDAARGGVVGGRFDVGGGRDIDDIDVAEDGGGVRLTVAGPGVPGEDEQLRWGQVVDLGRAGGPLLTGAVGIDRQRDDVLPCVDGIASRGVVDEQPGLEALGLFGTAFLVQSRLHQGIQGVAVGGNGQTFETLVVIAPAVGVGGGNGDVRFVAGRRGRREADGAVATGNVGFRRADRLLHPSIPAEFVDVWTVLVADPNRTITIDHQGLTVDRNPSPAGARIAKAIAGVCCDGEVGESAVCDTARGIGIQTRDWSAVWAGEEDCVQIPECEIAPCRLCSSGVGSESQVDGKLVHPILNIQSSLSIPASKLWSASADPVKVIPTYHPRSGMAQNSPSYFPSAVFLHRFLSKAIPLPMPPMVSPNLSRASEAMNP